MFSHHKISFIDELRISIMQFGRVLLWMLAK